MDFILDLDKSLFDENLDDVAGLQQYWSNKKALEVSSEYINISVVNKRIG